MQAVPDTEQAAAARRAVDHDPSSADRHAALGVTLAAQGDTLEAARAFEQANRLRPDDPAILTNLGLLLSRLGQHQTAILCLRHATALCPNDPRGIAALASVLYRSGQIPTSLPAHRRVVELTPDNPTAWIALGDCLAAIGERDEAIRSFRRALAIDPAQVAAFCGLAACGPGSTSALDIERLADLLDQPVLTTEARIAAGFALGQMLDTEERFDAAFVCFATANRLWRETRAAAGQRFDSTAFEITIDRLIQQTTQDVIASAAGLGDPSELPIFIVGMPRSGSTLVEQILASHSAVYGAGESNDLVDMLKTLSARAGSRNPMNWGASIARDAATRHLETLRTLAGETGRPVSRVVNKALDTLFYLDQIAVLFPNARVIICRRDPRDVCLSCHFHRFAVENLYTNDLRDCARVALAVERLIEHWRAVLPLRMIDVVHESLVDSPEAEIWRLIDFLDLPREAACLAPHRTARVVTTSSRWQIRQPINRRGIGRWRHYRQHLGDLLDVLGDPG
jgi:Flp pilus assembly protein TadD